MLKKVLYIICVAMIGFTVVMFSLILNMGRVHSAQIQAAIDSGDYTNAEKYYSYVFDDNDQRKFFKGDVNGVHIESYSAINSGYRTAKDSEGADTQFYSLENTIGFAFFNLPSSFDMADVYEEDGETIKTQGGVELVYEGTDVKVFFPFVSSTVDYYSETSVYVFLPFAINVNEYNEALTKAGLSTDAKIISANVYDGKHDAEDTLSFTFTNTPTFNTEFFTYFNSIIEEYNTLQAKALSETVEDSVITDLQNRYVSTVNNSGYAIKHDASVYLGTFDYIFSVVITCVIFAAAAILIGILLFKKKKSTTYIPPSQRKGNAVKPQPEQFSRDVFNVEEDVVEEVQEETTTKEPVEEVTNE